MSILRLTFLGTSAAAPTLHRNVSGMAVKADSHLLLFDCGEGTQMQLFHYGVRFDRCNQLFISHLHGDHLFGLMGIIGMDDHS